MEKISKELSEKQRKAKWADYLRDVKKGNKTFEEYLRDGK